MATRQQLQDIRKWRQEGYKATLLEECPYKPDSKEAFYWRQGWSLR